MKERFQADIYLAGVSSSGMKYLLEYIYTAKLELDTINIQEVISAASHLQVPQVVEACSNYLEVHTVSMHQNCCKFLSLVLLQGGGLKYGGQIFAFYRPITKSFMQIDLLLGHPLC